MSKDVSLVFDVSDESTQIIKSQLQGIFEEINKQPHSIKVAIDGASYGEVVNKLQEIRQLTSSTGAFKVPNVTPSNISAEVQNTESQISGLINIISQLNQAFVNFASDGSQRAFSFISGIAILNNSLKDIYTITGDIKKAMDSLFKDPDQKALSYAQHLETIASLLGEINGKTVNVSSDQTDDSTGEVKRKRRTESEKELKSAVEEETAAEEKRKISLTQFLSLYEKLSVLQNQNTHIKNSDQYSAITQAKNDLTDTYNQLKNFNTDVDNILEIIDQDVNKVAQAFDRGTVAAKQFKTVLPTVADGVKIQDVLKTINSANSTITKHNNADGDKNISSYKNLNSLVEELEKRIGRAEGAFKRLDGTVDGTGEKVSDILRRITIESENLKAETAIQVAKNKAKNSAEDEKKLADSVNAENEAEKKRLISLKDYLDLRTQLKNLVNQNTIMEGRSDQYQNAVNVLRDMDEVYQRLIVSETNLDDITKVVGNDIVTTFDKGKLVAEQLKAAIPNESDGVKYEAVLSKITSINRLLNNNKGMEITNPNEWKALQDSVGALEKLVDRGANKFRVLGEDEAKSAQLASEKLRIATAEMENFKNAIPVASAETTAFDTVANQVEKIGKLLRTNRHLEGSEYYKALKESMIQLNDLLDRTSGKLREMANESEGEGTKLSNAMDKSTLAMLNFNYEVNNTKKEAKEASIDLEKMIGQMNGWKRTLVSASKQGITSSTNKDYDNLTKLLALFDKVRAAVKENPGLTLAEAFNAEKLSQADAINKIMQANIASKDLSRTIINLKNNELSLNATEKERQAVISKTYRLLNTMNAALKNWDKAKTGKTSESYSQIKEGASALNKYINQLKNGKIDIEKFNQEVAKIRYSFEANSSIIKNAGENVRSFGSNLKQVAKSFSMWFSLTSIVMRAYSSMKQMMSASIELDDAMTQLKIVTTETDTTYKNFGNTLADVAKRTASSISDITSSTTTYARLGYTLEDAAKIAEYTAKLQNVGDIQVSDAQDAITAILKAYDGIDADHIEDVMNKLVVTGNNFPISVSQIAEGMNNASSALAAAGNTFEQSVALLTAANTTIQDAAKSSTAMRTIAARLRKTDSELEALGESMTSSKYDALVKSLADLNVGLVDVNGEYRATYDIIADIASKWDSMSSMEQAALADLAAGTRQQSAFFSLIEQFKEASGAMDAMANSAGVLDDAYSTYLDSTTAHINQFKAALQELSSDTFNSNFMSTIVDGARTFIEFADAIAKAKLGVVALASAVGMAAFASWRKNVAADAMRAQVLATKLVTEKQITDELSISINALNKNQIALIQSRLYAAYASQELSYEQYKEMSSNLELMVSEKALEAENYSLAGSFKAVTAAIPVWGWFIIGITAVTAVMGAVIKKAEEMKREFQDNTKEINSQIDALEQYKKRIKDISESDSSPTEKLKEYNSIRQEIIDGYNITIDKINDESKAVDVLNSKLETELENKRKLYLRNNEQMFESTVGKSEDFVQNISVTDAFSKFWRKELVGDWREIYVQKIFGDKNIAQNILDIFDSGTGENLTTGEIFGIGKDAKNELELLDILKNAYIRFGDIKEARELAGNELTAGEQALYDALYKQYTLLEENLGEDGFDFNSALEYATVKVKQLAAQIPQGSMSLDEWRVKLIEAANGEQLFIDKINEMINALKEAEDNSVIDPFESLSNTLTRVEEKLERINEAIKTANDYFEDLAKVIDKNNESDKFFTADEMIDMLDKYPELADNILVTAYGYKFEADALDELRKAKLDEQKTAISAQIAEAKGAKENAEGELSAITAKLNGISTLADAEIALAEVEEQLNNGGYEEGGYISNQLSEKRKNLQGAIDAWKRINAANQSIEKATMQYTLLGNVFKDLKDKTNDATKALNNKKEALKNLSDEYKKAKDNIEDLIKLTMEMIKKEKELQRDALKQQLEDFKKLIAKRKELIDLEKEQYDFENDLKEQNKDLLKIQQELDALSIAGVQYSLEDLKRKAELEEQLAEQAKKRDEFLFNHEVDVRKDALDKEQENFEEQINTQIKEIENYLDHEGKIRQDAVDLINGKSEQFYNDLLNYTMDYTTKSRFEFDKLWSDAYAALEKYGNGQIDVDRTLAYLIGRIADTENQINALDKAVNAAKSTADAFTNGFKEGMEGVKKVTAEEIDAIKEEISAMNGLAAASANALSAASAASHNLPMTLAGARDFLYSTAAAKKDTQHNAPMSLYEARRLMYEKHHTGGIAGGSALTKNSEVLAKLLKGEVVVTTGQADNFMKNTLPKLAASTNISNQVAPTISIGDINIAGNADASTVEQLKNAQKEIVDNVFKTINSQKNIFNGNRLR